MPHNFKLFPELTNSQMQFYYFQSPHKQITEDFRAEVVKVHDGDTITVRTNFRDFDFPIRFLDTNAPELNEAGGKESKEWMEQRLLGKNIEVLIDKKQRVGKYGRLLGIIVSGGLNINEASVRMGKSTPFNQRNEGKLPKLSKEINIKKWLA